MLTFEILGTPVPWKAHAGFGKRSFNPRYKEKHYVQWQIRPQFNRTQPITTPVKGICTFHMPIPAGVSKIRRRQMLEGRIHHIKRPDVDNLSKFLFDCLKGIVIEDDSQIVEVVLRKIYGETPKTIFLLEEITHPPSA